MGDGGFDVEIGQMDRAKQLFDRQQGHMAAINSYIGRTCTAPGAFRGLMGLLQGHYSDTLASAQTGMTSGAGIAEHCSTKISQTQSTYLDKDRQAYDRFAAKEKAAGRTVAPYKPPAGGGPLGPAQQTFPGPKAGEAGSGGSAVTYLTGTAKEIGKAGLQEALDRNDPENRRANPNRLDQWRAGLYNRCLYGSGEGLDPAGGYRTGDDYSHNTRMQSGFDQGYHRGSRYAADHVPDGTAYTGAADQDGNITQNRRPGSAWASDEATAPVRAVTAGQELYNETTDTIQAGTDLYDAYQTNQDVHHLADGPSNTGSRDWSTHDTKGGTW
ncbi:hypothetical protein ABEG17_01220 [Pedococcus sp. KACC 23699]|uniref:WXG100 family type VII secretion target n=1 Tax=Pedococcus sp. KACC 23699 TaxID=3149228 RepID=A0AAU7JV89_9MICO